MPYCDGQLALLGKLHWLEARSPSFNEVLTPSRPHSSQGFLQKITTTCDVLPEVTKYIEVRYPDRPFFVLQYILGGTIPVSHPSSQKLLQTPTKLQTNTCVRERAVERRCAPTSGADTMPWPARCGTFRARWAAPRRCLVNGLVSRFGGIHVVDGKGWTKFSSKGQCLGTPL